MVDKNELRDFLYQHELKRDNGRRIYGTNKVAIETLIEPLLEWHNKHLAEAVKKAIIDELQEVIDENSPFREQQDFIYKAYAEYRIEKLQRKLSELKGESK